MRHSICRRARAFTLVELLVVIAIIGTLMGLLLPAVQNARESGRSNVCRSNLANLQKAMASYEVANKEYPGYVNAVGVLQGHSASWGGMVLPYIEQQQMWEELNQGKKVNGAVEVYVCPSNPSQYEGGPSMSYLANAGWIQGEKIKAEGDNCALKENPANGVFFDRTRTQGGAAAGGDIRDLVADCQQEELDPVIKMTFASAQAQGDGSTHTLMFAEGINAGVWIGIDQPDKKWHYGFCWERPETVVNAMENGVSNPMLELDPRYRTINGATELLPKVEGDKAPNSGFPSSHHPGGVNVAFCGGQVVFLSERISPIVYAQLMTSNRKLSDLVVQDKRDRDLPTPDADDY